MVRHPLRAGKYKMFFGWLGFKQLFVYLSTMKKKITKSISELLKQKMTLTLDMFMYYTSVCLVVALSFLMYFWSKKKLRSKKLTEKILTILACILSMVLHNYFWIKYIPFLAHYITKKQWINDTFLSIL